MWKTPWGNPGKWSTCLVGENHMAMFTEDQLPGMTEQECLETRAQAIYIYIVCVYIYIMYIYIYIYYWCNIGSIYICIFNWVLRWSIPIRNWAVVSQWRAEHGELPLTTWQVIFVGNLTPAYTALLSYLYIYISHIIIYHISWIIYTYTDTHSTFRFNVISLFIHSFIWLWVKARHLVHPEKNWYDR